MPSPRADYRCDVCEERWELPLTAKTCPDEDCPGLLHRIWDAAGSPRIAAAQFRRVTNLLDHGQHAQRPTISHEMRRDMALAERDRRPGFVPVGPQPGQMLAPHFAQISRGFAVELSAATARPVSDTGGRPREVDATGSGFAESILAAAKARGPIRPAGDTMVDKASAARGAAMRAAYARRVEGK